MPAGGDVARVASDGTATTGGNDVPDPARSNAGVLVLLAAVSFAAFAQGAFYASRFRVVQVLVAVALALGLRRLEAADARSAPVLAAGAVSASIIVSAVAVGDPSSALPLVGLLATLAAVAVLVSRLDASGLELLVQGILGITTIVALTGWIGVVLHAAPWAMQAQGLWRASSVITYANGTAALLVPAALVAGARLARRPDDRLATGALFVLLTGVGATLSRGGAVALLVGALVLAGVVGVRATIRGSWRPAVGSVVATAALVPSFGVGSPPRPAVALLGLGAGLAVALLDVRPRLVAGALALCALTLPVLVGEAVGPAVDRLGSARLSTASEDRADEWRETTRLASERPLVGVGPGRFLLTYTKDGREVFVRYAHNEYLQVLAEHGALGLAAALAAMGALGWALWRGRRDGSWLWSGAVAGSVAIAVHATFDFVWHIPVIPLLGALLIGAGIRERRATGGTG